MGSRTPTPSPSTSASQHGGGLPPEARDDREFGAEATLPEGPAPKSRDDREIGAEPTLPEDPPHQASAPEEPCCARFIGPADVVQLFRALLCTVRRRMEREQGRLPTPGEALGVMLDHVFSSWGGLDGKLAARHKVFARDGWHCAVPAPDGLRWEMGIRPGVTPLLACRSGDVRVPAQLRAPLAVTVSRAPPTA